MGSRRHGVGIRGSVLAFAAVLVLGACGGDSSGPDGGGSVAGPGFMVGDWIATALVVTSQINPAVSVDLIAQGATFTLLVQPSGRYTAILSGFGQASSESGTLSVEGNEVVFRRSLPTPEVSRSAFVRNGSDVTLTGPTEFDFNLDGEVEAATLVITLTPR